MLAEHVSLLNKTIKHISLLNLYKLAGLLIGVKMEKKVLTFYYAWYGTPWGPAGKWLGWNAVGYNPDIVVGGRRQIATAEYPLDGVYDSCDEYTLRRHLRQAEFAGIDGFILSWWGFEHYSHKALEKLLNLALKDFITIYYETAMTLKLRDEKREVAIERIYSDLKRLLEEYASKESWIKVDGKPLLVIYIADQYSVKEWKYIREKLEKNYEFFLLGDTFDLNYLEVFDGLHIYTPVRYSKRGIPLEDVYLEVSKKIKEKGKLFASAVCPGYDDRRIRQPGIFIPREDGRYYIDCWKASFKASADWILITSWNEWLEGTEIEPSLEYGYNYLYITKIYSKKFKES